MATCSICGALVGDGNRHLDWHASLGAPVDQWGDCPIDGAPVGFARHSPDGSGEVQWGCGHMQRWVTPDPGPLT